MNGRAAREQLQLVAGGYPALVPAFAAAVRLVPNAQLGGLAAYPRTAQINGRTVVVTGPDWWPVGVASSGNFQVTVAPGADVSAVFADQVADPAQGFIGFQGQDPVVENWLVEYVDSLEGMAAPAEYFKGYRKLWSSANRAWASGGKGDCSPIFDLRPFDEILLTTGTTNTGFNCTTWWPTPNPEVVSLFRYQGVVTGPGGGGVFFKRNRFVNRAAAGVDQSGEANTSPLGSGILMLQLSAVLVNTTLVMIEGRLR